MIYHPKKYYRVLSVLPMSCVLGLKGFALFVFFKGYLLEKDFAPVDVIGTVILFSVLLLGMWSYLVSVFRDPGTPKRSLDPLYIPDDRLEHYCPGMNEDDFERAKLNFCSKCSRYRPTRAHHCSHCERCILRYDHHCPWIANCVGLLNHKAFVLFLLYYGVGGLVMGVLCLLFVLEDSHYSVFSILGAGLGFVFFFSLTGFGVMHLWMILKNFTNLEMGEEFNVFDTKNVVKNLSQVFGENKKLWLVPLGKPSADGHLYPIRVRMESCNEPLLFEDKYLVN